jgi:hypothetical protein
VRIVENGTPEKNHVNSGNSGKNTSAMVFSVGVRITGNLELEKKSSKNFQSITIKKSTRCVLGVLKG